MTEYNFEYEVRLENDEERTVSGIAVPYDDTISVSGQQERFMRGAVENAVGIPLFYQHKEPIGKIVRTRDGDGGLEISAQISKTDRGNEVYTLLKDNVLNKFSVGFQPVEDNIVDGVVERRKVDLKEVSVVSFPAYENASVSEVREDDSESNQTVREDKLEKENMEIEQISTEVSEVRTGLEDLERRMDTINVATPTVENKPLFRSQGEYAKALVEGNKEARELFERAATDSSNSVVEDAWIGDLSRVIDRGRPTVSAFSTQPLPASGLNVEYAQIASNSVATAKQSAEAADLTFGEVVLETVTAPVNTYGGYTELTRQIIERSSVNYLDTAFRAMTVGYAKATNKVLVDAIEAVDYATAGFQVTKAGNTAADWLGALAEAADAIDANQAMQLDGVLVAPDVWVSVVGIVDGSDRGQIVAGNPSNSLGSGSIPGLSANVAGVPFIVERELAAGTAYAFSKSAYASLESAGAPARLQDENIVNLTKAFSVYGYLAITHPFAGAVVEIA